MINSVQTAYNYKTSAIKKQKAGFGAVNLKNYSPERLKKACCHDFSKRFPDKPIDIVYGFGERVAGAIHNAIEPLIKRFSKDRDKTLTVAIEKMRTGAGDEFDNFHVIGVALNETGAKIPKGKQVLSFLVDKDIFLKDIQKFHN